MEEGATVRKAEARRPRGAGAQLPTFRLLIGQHCDTGAIKYELRSNRLKMFIFAPEKCPKYSFDTVLRLESDSLNSNVIQSVLCQ